VRTAWRAELLKIATVRGQWIAAILATAALPLTSLLVATTASPGTGGTTTSRAVAGSIVGLLAFGAWGASLAAGEYGTQTIVVSLATVPRRPVLYAAKIAAAATIAGVGALLSAVSALLLVLAVTPPSRHAFGNPAALMSVVLVMIAVAVVGVAIGVITRSPTMSIAIVVVALLLPKAAGGLLGRIEPWVVGASPDTVITQIVGGASLPTSQIYPAGTWAAAATMALVAAALATAGAIALTWRDG
jgi:ABC-type transport system involved in multi-copper enzyme maturation permease subunit